MNRLSKILLGVLVVQLAILAVVLSVSGEQRPSRPQPLLAGFDAAKVTRVQIFPAKDDQAGVTAQPPTPPIDLVKRGESWVVASSHDYPALSTPITDLLSKLGGLTHAGAIARGAARAKQLGVADEDYQRKVVLTIGGKDVALLVGNPVGSRQTAVRLGSDAAVMAVSNLSPWAIDAQLRTWVTPTYAEVPRDQISQVLVQRDGQSVQLLKDGGQWKVQVDGAPVVPAAGEVVDQAVVDEVLGQVSNVELTAVADPKAAEGKVKATISVWTAAPAPAPGADVPAAGSAAGAAAGSGSAAAAPPAAPAVGSSAAPALVFTVVERAASFVVNKRGATHAVEVDGGRLRATVELSSAKLLKKESKPAAPAPGAAAAPAAAAPGPALAPDQVPGLVSP